MVDDLILQVNSGDVLWVGHSHSQQDAHQQVDDLRRGRRRRRKVFKIDPEQYFPMSQHFCILYTSNNIF